MDVNSGFVWPDNYRARIVPSKPTITYAPSYVNLYNPPFIDGGIISGEGPRAETTDALMIVHVYGGVAPFGYKREKVSGDDITPNSPESFSTKFSGIVPYGEERQAVYRCRIFSSGLSHEYDLLTPPVTVYLIGENAF